MSSTSPALQMRVARKTFEAENGPVADGAGGQLPVRLTVPVQAL